MKAIIIDDSRLARNELRRLLKDFDTVHILGEASNASEAKEKIEQKKPDFIFLDIQMPGKNGFELLEDLDFLPEVIFTTAYDEYALKAFDVNALDYLVKPIEKDRLAAAMSKIEQILRQKNEQLQNRDLLGENDQVFVKDGDKCWFVKLADIKLFEINGNYTRIYFDDIKPMIPRTLNYMESRLDDKIFFRANRQQLINLKWVERIVPWFSGSLKIYLKGGDEVEVSRRQTQRFKELMSF
ncbi:response regulator [Fulvivirgaceae bacterium BMA10]|uniref:Response regulator n=1 Tax=Splendidivirga corallicola TaxID=3051826 RepID=A0ABT8KRD0_9BACT|nr:response regulator [Fulvivirgaceae bacterium BMA10]